MILTHPNSSYKLLKLLSLVDKGRYIILNHMVALPGLKVFTKAAVFDNVHALFDA